MSKHSTPITLLWSITIMLSYGCKKEDPPSLVTSEVTHVLLHSVVAGGIVTADGSDVVTETGICWSLNDPPDLNDNKVVYSGTSDTISVKITGLESWTTYYFRSYAISSAGIGYGPVVSGETLSPALMDADQNLYKVVQIGDQVWMAENLRTTTLADGTPIALRKTGWYSSAPAYCWHGNNEAANKYPYGALYNWHAVSHEDFCPDGWRVPTDNDWTVLINYLGGMNLAADRLKESGWVYWPFGNQGATNESGFTARPAGMRLTDGEFYPLGYDAYWWSATAENSYDARYWHIFINYSGVITDKRDKMMGHSVRLMRD